MVSSSLLERWVPCLPKENIKDMSSKLPCFWIRRPVSKPMRLILPVKQGEGWSDLQVFFIDPLYDAGKNSELEGLDPEPKETVYNKYGDLSLWEVIGLDPVV